MADDTDDLGFRETDENLNDYDATTRRLVFHHAAEMLPFLLRHRASDFRLGPWVDTRRVTGPGDPPRTNDLAAEFTFESEGGRPRLVLVEIDFRPRRGLAGRLLVCAGHAIGEKNPTGTTGDEFAVVPVAVALTGRPNADRDTRTAEGFGYTVRPSAWPLEHLHARDFLTAVALGNNPWPALAWVPLMRDATQPATLDEFRRLVDARPAEERALIRRAAIIYAGVRRTRPVWREVFRGMPMGIRDLYCDELRAEGETSARRASIARVLARRLGNVPAAVPARLESISSAERLDELIDAAATVSSIDEFVAVLG